MNRSGYAGRIAPTPTGFLHAGHALTFFTAAERARAAGGRILLRIEDLDPHRCKPDFVRAAIEDLRWLGIRWDEGPVFQSERRARYLNAWRMLRDLGVIYPCRRSRRDVAGATLAPHSDEPVFPPEWRTDPASAATFDTPAGVNWRFRVPDGEQVTRKDENLGEFTRITGRDFGDFLVWNRDDLPAYELAVVVDDLEDGITEIVRGADLLTSTVRQHLIANALGGTLPATFHCPLVGDASGRRLAKRDGGSEIRNLRAEGYSPESVLAYARSRLLPGAEG